MTKSKKQESESTELVVLTPEEQAYLDRLKLEQGSQEYSGPARLMINTKSKDEDGVKRPIGGWKVTGINEYYDGAISFRPVRYSNILIRYEVDPAGNYKVAAESVYFKDYLQEIPDSLGGNALGRKFGRKYSDEEKEATRKLAEVYLDIFGLVTFKDNDNVQNYPVIYRVRGTKLRQMTDVFNAVPKGKQFSQFNYTLETEQNDKSQWMLKVTPELGTLLPIAPILEWDNASGEFIQEHNIRILNKFKENSARATEDKLVNSSGKTVESDNTEDMDDELPF